MIKDNFFIVLNKTDLDLLTQGESIFKIFQVEKDLLFVVSLGKENLSKHDFKGVLESGDSATHIQIDDSQINEIRNTNNAVKVHYKDFTIMIISEDTHNRLKAEAPASTKGVSS